MAAIEDYTDLITSEHNKQPNFMAVVAASIQPFVDGLNTIESIVAAYDLDIAAGNQLDVLGIWIGLSRRLRVPIPNVYFSFNIAGLGFNQGVWYSPGDPLEGVISMDDATYRIMLKAKIAANTWTGSLEDANLKLQNIFAGGSVVLKDNFDMTQEFILSGDAPSVLFETLVEQGYIQLRPAGVALA